MPKVVKKPKSRFAGLSDDELVSVIVGSSMKSPDGQDASAEIYGRHHKMVSTLCSRILTDESLAEDATQETFMSAFTSMDNYTPEPSDKRRFESWLYVIARNRCLTMNTHTSREKSRPLSTSDRRLPDLTPKRLGDMSPETKDSMRVLEKAIEQLPPQRRATIVGVYVEGKAIKQVAERHGMSVGAVKTSLYRGRKTLKKTLKKNDFFLK